jgi:cellobiose phosphorylase
MAPDNLGEHGLCKIREGDRNDSVNRAGLEGRGESVMVSCHLIYCLKQAAKLIGALPQYASMLPASDECLGFSNSIQEAIRKHALNTEGYLNAVFTDSGQWIFSPSDPAGKARFNVPANAFGIIGGIFDRDEIDVLCEHFKRIRTPYGYPLFTPALGVPPLDRIGRIGSGDLPPGLGENGTCYNHGCHGFLARAMAEAGKGHLYYDVMRFLFSYDQERHPVEQSKTGPHAIVNVYKSAPGREGEGGDSYFSGTIAVAVRNIYQGMLCVHAEPDGLRICPCLPSDWDCISGRIQCAGQALSIDVKREGGTCQ